MVKAICAWSCLEHVTLETREATCLSQVNELSTCRPNSLCVLSTVIVNSSSPIEKLSMAFRILCTVPINILSVFGIFKTMQLISIQLYIGLDSSVNWLLISLTVQAFLHIVESSAYISNSETLTSRTMSFMNNMNISGPRMDPWGTPSFIWANWDW